MHSEGYSSCSCVCLCLCGTANYSTRQTQGIKQTRFTRGANAFGCSCERVSHEQRTSSCERVSPEKRTRLGPRANAFHTQSARVLVLVRTRFTWYLHAFVCKTLISDGYCRHSTPMDRVSCSLQNLFGV